MSVAKYKSNTKEVEVVHFTVGNQKAVLKFLEDTETMVWIRCHMEDEFNILCLDTDGISHQLFENCYVLFDKKSVDVMEPDDFNAEYTLVEEAIDDDKCVSPTIVENPNNTATDYRLDITDVNGTFTTPNLKGADGAGGGTGGITQETDPTVPAWAKEPQKPVYDYGEIQNTPASLPADGGNADTVNNLTVQTAVPENAVFTDTVYDDTDIKGRVTIAEGEIDNLEGQFTDLDNRLTTVEGEVGNIPTVPQWALEQTKPTYDYGEIQNTPTSLPADGGNADTVNGLTVETAVPADAKFTDTIYDDTDVKNRLDTVEGEVDDLEGRVVNLENGQTTGGITVETDPTVPAWAKEATKPTYDYGEIQNTPDSLPADGGNADTVNNLTVETAVPVGAKFTDTIYDDTQVKSDIATVQQELETLELSLDTKQNTLNANQIQAVDSGITQAKVTQYDDAVTTIQNLQTNLDGKQDKLSETQLQNIDAVPNKANSVDVYTKTESDNTFIKSSEKGQANGVATLDSSGKVVAEQINLSALNLKGGWDASTNTPSLQNDTGNQGDTYICEMAGTVDFGSGDISFLNGDFAIYMEGEWHKSINSNAVASVNGKTGAVTLIPSDILSQTQIEAVDSGITQAKVAQYDNNLNNQVQLSGRIDTLEDSVQEVETDLLVVEGKVTNLQNDKQNTLTQQQLDAVNSGITQAKVTSYDNTVQEVATIKTNIDGKQDKLSTAQLEAIDSGITQAKVASYDNIVTNQTQITGRLDNLETTTQSLETDKQDTLTQDQLNAVNSTITLDKVTNYDNAVTELATLTGRVDDVETELDTKTSIDDTQAADTTTYSSNKIDESLVLKQDKLVGGVKQFVGFDENGNAKAVDNLWSESTLASVATETDFTENDARTYTVDNEGTIVSDTSFRLAFNKNTCEPCLNFGGVYSLEWEVARYVHYIALERNPENGGLLLIALGGGDTNPSSPVKGITGMVIKVENGVQTILRQYYDTSLTPIQYLFKSGDKVRAVRNEDGSVTFYRTTNANDSFTEWFTTDIKDIFPEKILGFACGFTSQEFIAPFGTDDMKVANKVQVQKTYNPDIEFLRDEISKKEDINKVYDKFVVVAIAGQSNAVGYDESPVIDNLYTKPIDNNRIRQLGFYGDDNLELIPLSWCAQNMQDMRAHNRAGTDTAGTKGIHLPLANALLEYVPEDYGILILPIAFGGTGFNSGNNGTYDSTNMKPSETGAGEGTVVLKWGTGTAYYQTLRDRIKYALELNQDNKFAGIVWCQGEFDNSNPTGNKNGFEAMTELLFTELNDAGLGNRTPKGTFDRDIWYNMETVAYWYGLHGSVNIWDNYRTWNPKTYIEIPRTADSNAINGTGSTTANRPSHFGNDAFSKVVAPRVAQALLNGNAFSNINPTSDDLQDIPLKDTIGTMRTDSNPYGANVEEYRTAIQDDFSVNHATSAFSADSEGTITSSETLSGKFAWSTCEPTINFRDVYSVEWEVSRNNYWFIVEGNVENKELTLIGLGGGAGVSTGGKTGQISYIARGGLNTVKTSQQTSGLQYNFVTGDRIRAVRNRDKSTSFYRTDNANGIFQHWFTYPKFGLVEGDMFGFSVGIAGDESNGVGAGDITVAKKIKIQKDEIAITNKYMQLEFESLDRRFDEVNQTHLDITNMVGDLSDLDTTDKTSIVEAINELAVTSGGSSAYTPNKWRGSLSSDIPALAGTSAGSVTDGSITFSSGLYYVAAHTSRIKGMRFTIPSFSGDLGLVVASQNDNFNARAIPIYGTRTANYVNETVTSTSVSYGFTVDQLNNFFGSGGTFEIILSDDKNAQNSWNSFTIYRVKDGEKLEGTCPTGTNYASRLGFVGKNGSSGTIKNIEVWER